MLAEVVRICDENGLAYYAAGGTTLGAIRHKGFIPWDDDVDIMMPRQDWQRFVEIARAGGLPENRKLCCFELDENYPHVFGRYADTETCAIHYNQFLGGTAEGLVIDIFIMDPVPDGGDSYQAHREALSLYNDMANSLGYSYPMSSSTVQLNHYARRMRAEGRRAVLTELAQEVGKYDDGEYLVMRWAAAPRLFHKSMFAFERHEPFENLSISVPSKCNDYLVYHYGDDWAQLPSHSGRLTHDAITFTDVDYRTVLDDYLPFLDVERTKRAILKRRDYHIQHMAELHRAEDLRARIVAAFTRESTIELAATCGYDLEGAFADGRHDLLDKVFGDYYRHQCAPELEGREEYLTIRRYHDPILIDIGEGLMRIALLNLIDTNRVARAARILRVYRLAKGPLPTELLDVEQRIDAVRLPRSLDDLGCEDEALELSEYVLDALPGNFSNRAFLLGKLDGERDLGASSLAERAAQDFETASANEVGEAQDLDPLSTGALNGAGDLDRKREMAEAGLQRFPLSGEYLKEVADCDLAQATTQEQVEEAYKSYVLALGRTTNSFLADEVLARAKADDRILGTDIVSDLEEAAASARQEVPQKIASLNALRAGERALELLGELERLCDERGIAHFAGPLTCLAARACSEGSPSEDYPLPPELDLLVPANQMERLAEAISEQRNPDRTTDSWLTNGNCPSFQLCYVDASTTFLQLDEGTDIAAPGIRVVVLPVRTDLGNGDRITEIEEGWELNGYKLTKGINAKKALRAGEARVAMLQGRKRAARTLFHALCKRYDESAQDVWVRLLGRRPATFPAACLGAGQQITLADQTLTVPADIDCFLSCVFGASWKDGAGKLLAKYDGALATASVPYAAFLTLLKDEGCSCDELFSLMRKIRFGMLPLANDLRIRNHAMRVAERTRDRKLHYDALHAQDAAIHAALDRGDYEELGSLFADYEKDARAYLRDGLALCPSKEYLAILCEILRHKGEEETARRLVELAPEAHFRPLA